MEWLIYVNHNYILYIALKVNIALKAILLTNVISVEVTLFEVDLIFIGFSWNIDKY